MTEYTRFQEDLFVDRESKLFGFNKLLRPETPQAIMLIEAEQKMGKSWLVAKMHQLYRVAHQDMPAVYLDFRNPLDRSRISDHLTFLHLLQERIDCEEFFEPLTQLMQQLTATPSSTKTSKPLTALVDDMQLRYTMARLEELAFRLNVEWENLEGTTKFNRTFALVRELYQRNELDALFAQLHRDRPKVDWDRHAVALEETTATTFAAEFPTDRTNGSRVPFVPPSDEELRRAESQLNEAFFASLVELMAAKGQLVFLFDAFESAPTVAQHFIVNQLVPRVLDEQLQRLVIIITGRKTPDLSPFNIGYLLVKTGLEPFTEEHIRDFMQVRSIQEDPPDFTWSGVLRLSGGVPGDLALMADRLTAAASKEDPFFTA